MQLVLSEGKKSSFLLYLYIQEKGMWKTFLLHAQALLSRLIRTNPSE